MMKLMIKEVAQAKGFKNAKHLADEMSEFFGVRISYATIYPLWDDKAQLWSRDTFDKLCTFLKVPAGMLIQHIEGEWSLQEPEAGSRQPARKASSSRKIQKSTRRAAPAVAGRGA